jgi:hypothetical protein
MGRISASPLDLHAEEEGSRLQQQLVANGMAIGAEPVGLDCLLSSLQGRGKHIAENDGQ